MTSRIAITGWARWSGELVDGVRRVPPDRLKEVRVRERKAIRAVDRACKLVLGVAARALQEADLPLPEEVRPEAGLVTGTAFGCLESNQEYMEGLLEGGPRLVSPRVFSLTVPSAPAGVAAIEHRLGGAAATVMAGGSSSSAALALGLDLIRAGLAERVLAGSYETLAPGLLWAMERLGLTGAFVPAEGAALLVLEPLDRALERGATIRGILAGAGAARGGPEALERAARQALDDPSLEGASGATLHPSGGGWDKLDRLESEVGASLGLPSAPGEPARARFGIAFGAAGALAATACLESWSEAPPEGPVLLLDPSWDGCQGALVLNPWEPGS